MTNRPMSGNGIICLLASVIFLSGCASTIPLTRNMSDAVMMGVKPSQTKTVSYEYVSHVPDGEIQTCAKDIRKARSGSDTYVHSESSTLQKMIREYLSMKFARLDKDADPKIKVVLKDFGLEEYTPPESLGKRIVDRLLGGDRNAFFVVNLDLVFQVTRADSTVRKAIHVCADAAKIDHVRSILFPPTKEDSSPSEPPERLRVAKVINNANNKAIIMLNQFLESNQL